MHTAGDVKPGETDAHGDAFSFTRVCVVLASDDESITFLGQLQPLSSRSCSLSEFRASDYIGRLRKQIRDAGLYPAGHYYSPIPKYEEIVVHLESTKTDKLELPAIDLNRQSQFEILTAFQAFYDDLPFPETKNQEC